MFQRYVLLVACLLAASPLVLAPDGTVVSAGSQWNGAQWNGAQWNGAQWNGAQWNGAQWNGAQWNGAQWNGAQWNGAQWNGAQWNADPTLWGFTAIDVPEGWAAVSPPTSQLACIVDSGADLDHPAFAANVAHARSFIGDSAEDDAGHGTHMAGLVTAVGSPQLAIAKVLDATGHGRTEDVIDAVRWCLSLNADVILLALTETEPTPAFERAIARAAEHAVVVAAAGNHGPCDPCVGSPANVHGVLGVGAIDREGAVAGFTALGPELQVYAPGVDVASTFLDGMWISGSGTSQAAAFVAGAAALVAERHPDATPPRIAGAIARSAAPLNGEMPGLLQVGAALG